MLQHDQNHLFSLSPLIFRDDAAAGDGVQIGKAGQATMESTTCYRRVE
jgi:hypothetical protein